MHDGYLTPTIETDHDTRDGLSCDAALLFHVVVLVAVGLGGLPLLGSPLQHRCPQALRHVREIGVLLVAVVVTAAAVVMHVAVAMAAATITTHMAVVVKILFRPLTVTQRRIVSVVVAAAAVAMHMVVIFVAVTCLLVAVIVAAAAVAMHVAVIVVAVAQLLMVVIVAAAAVAMRVTVIVTMVMAVIVTVLVCLLLGARALRHRGGAASSLLLASVREGCWAGW